MNDEGNFISYFKIPCSVFAVRCLPGCLLQFNRQTRSVIMIQRFVPSWHLTIKKRNPAPQDSVPENNFTTDSINYPMLRVHNSYCRCSLPVQLRTNRI